MGVNLTLVSDDANPVKDWDPYANGGAKDIFKNLGGCLPVQYIEEDIVRPMDFAAWRAFVSAPGFPNSAMYLRMLDRLEQDERMAIHVSF